MTIIEKSLISKSLSNFLLDSDLTYETQLAKIPLFNPQLTSRWTPEQKHFFAAIFYHLRGHFINFIWYMANFAKDDATKKILVHNIEEEIGIGSHFSHEKLYDFFAKQCGVNIQDEIIHEHHYLPFAREFNKSHLVWLAEHDHDVRLATFAAYERLDNIDYPHLVELARSFKLPKRAMTFFTVHAQVEHFDTTLELLNPIWQQTPEKLQQAFAFINNHQYTMWRRLSDYVFNFAKAVAA